MEKKNLLRDMIVLWIAMTACLCANLNMHIVRNMLNAEETPKNGEK